MKKTLAIAFIIAVLAGTTAADAEVASWYGPGFHGHKTANGERFNMYALTAAHKTLPFGTRVLVSHGSKSVIVRINDRGPYVRGRSIDLSKAAAQKIGCLGVCKVNMHVLGKSGGRSHSKKSVRMPTNLNPIAGLTNLAKWLGPK